MKHENVQTNRRGIVGEIVSWILVIAVSIGIGMLINGFVLMKAFVPTGSMESTLNVGDHLFGNRLAYLFSNPERGDIVMFMYPDDGVTLYVKRIIGLPGETVEIIDGKVYIWQGDNEEEKIVLDEPYLKETPKGDYGPYYVPEDSYFMLGDNRNSSFDSREWVNKFVKKEEIRCKAWFRYKPDFGIIK